MDRLAEKIASELNIRTEYADNVIRLLDEGNTVPFIARYRKELHGSQDDTVLRNLEERLRYLRALQERRETIIKSIEDQGKMTDSLRQEIDLADTQAALEALYLPYKQKRRTRASIAREKGLEPLADALLLQGKERPLSLAEAYIDPEKGVETAEEALAGASDILAERFSEDADNRKVLRDFFRRNGLIVSKAAKEEDSVYRLYYDFVKSLNSVQGHQILAMNRGEKEGFLKVGLEAEDDKAKLILKGRVIGKHSPSEEMIAAAAEDAYSRLIRPSLERELRAELTEKACDGAIGNFAGNLRPLLMQPPVKGSVTMGLDPGYSHGCKTAVVDETGKVLDTAVVYPTFSEGRKQEAIRTLSSMIKKYGVRHIAIGNGTASRETEAMTAEMLKNFHGTVSYAIVNEAGASVYSASELAAREFPDYDVNLRSAVSIARRLQDPLAELVKIEPMAIGVGQYQHDMPEARLSEALDGVVEDCVNAVGADLNTASVPLLMRVSGLTKTTAANIVAFREENGAFRSRKQLLKVPKLGPKAYEQCAGFLRVRDSEQILDNTAVHPESYQAAEKLLKRCGYTTEDVRNGNIGELKNRAGKIGWKELSEELGTGIPTLKDIADELLAPGRDVRDSLPPVVLRQDVLDMSDLKPGMILQGTVRNVIDFGVFVDIGVHQDGLVHISQISDRFIKHPKEAVSVGDIVKVMVLDVDVKKKRISLSMKQAK